MISTFKMQRKG